jgi:hypothetical protein
MVHRDGNGLAAIPGLDSPASTGPAILVSVGVRLPTPSAAEFPGGCLSA